MCLRARTKRLKSTFWNFFRHSTVSFEAFLLEKTFKKCWFFKKKIVFTNFLLIFEHCTVSYRTIFFVWLTGELKCTFCREIIQLPISNTKYMLYHNSYRLFTFIMFTSFFYLAVTFSKIYWPNIWPSYLKYLMLF